MQQVTKISGFYDFPTLAGVGAGGVRLALKYRLLRQRGRKEDKTITGYI
jgi:hypothetical protein